MLVSEIVCRCPIGYPKRTRQDYGPEARGQAHIWNIPNPTFEVEAHTGECPRSDEVVALSKPTPSGT